jgi:hypothetical protein
MGYNEGSGGELEEFPTVMKIPFRGLAAMRMKGMHIKFIDKAYIHICSHKLYL